MSTILVLGLLALIYCIVQRPFGTSKRKLPPNPRGWPIIGNALQIGSFPWLQMTRWSKQLGMYMCHVFLRRILID